ncbi:unnamed protein product [Penicillium discolor]
MVKNKGNASWSLPGGAVEKEETLDQAAIREAKEETGLDVKVQGIIAINECIFEKKQEHAIFFTFRAEVIGGRLELIRPHEISEIAWMDVDKAERSDPMIVMINGAFGSGKTSAAKMLQPLINNSMIYDPEEIGYMIRKLIPEEYREENERTDDFQDI